MWAKQYKQSTPGSLDWWTYLAACTIKYVQGQEQQHEQRSREVAAYALAHGCGIWHAVWATSPVELQQKNKCYCVPCVKARGEKVTCI